MQVQCKLVRKGGTTIEFGGKEYLFAPNDQGDHVAEITDEAALHRLINEIPTAYALYGADAGKTVARPAADTHIAHPLNKGEKKAKDPEHLFITNGEGEQIDLMALEREELAAMAAHDFGIEVHGRWKADNLRAKIVEAIRVASADE